MLNRRPSPHARIVALYFCASTRSAAQSLLFTQVFALRILLGPAHRPLNPSLTHLSAVLRLGVGLLCDLMVHWSRMPIQDIETTKRSVRDLLNTLAATPQVFCTQCQSVMEYAGATFYFDSDAWEVDLPFCPKCKPTSNPKTRVDIRS